MSNNFITINLYLNEFEEQEEDNNVTFDPNEFPLRYDGNYNNGPVGKSFELQNAYSLWYAYYGINSSKYITVKCSDKDDRIVEILDIPIHDYYTEDEYTKDIRVFLENGKIRYSENVGSKHSAITFKTEKGRTFECYFTPDQPPVQ
jgi:hypothetical protein